MPSQKNAQVLRCLACFPPLHHVPFSFKLVSGRPFQKHLWMPTSSTQTYIKNYNFQFSGCYAVPLLYIFPIASGLVHIPHIFRFVLSCDLPGPLIPTFKYFFVDITIFACSFHSFEVMLLLKGLYPSILRRKTFNFHFFCKKTSVFL